MSVELRKIFTCELLGNLKVEFEKFKFPAGETHIKVHEDMRDFKVVIMMYGELRFNY